MNDDILDGLVGEAFAVDAEQSPELKAMMLARLRIEKRQRQRPRRFTAILVAAAICVSALATSSAYVLLRTPISTYDFPEYGRIEIVDPPGSALILSPEGLLLGETGSPKAGGERTTVRVGRHSQVVEGLGAHRIIDETGKLRFILDLRPSKGKGYPAPPLPNSVTELIDIQERALRARGGAGITVLPAAMLGNYDQLDLHWRLEGVARVQFTVGAFQSVGESNAFTPGYYQALGIREDYSPQDSPRLTWEVQGVKHQHTGFGTVQFVDSSGRAIGSLVIKRAARNEPR